MDAASLPAALSSSSGSVSLRPGGGRALQFRFVFLIRRRSFSVY
jgi:hypothetical protein